MPNRSALCLALLASLAAPLLGGCGSGSSSSASTSGGSNAGQTITLYNGQHEQTTAMLMSAFERQTHVKVKVRSDDEATLADQILQEGENSPADVFYTENTPALEELREHGLLATLPATTLASVPSRYSSPEGAWVGVSARASVLVYNTNLLSPSQLPNSVLELAEPKWRGKLGFAPSETDFQPLITAVTKVDGAAAAERWLEGMKANGTIYPDNETVVAQVNNGESAIGPINHYYWYRLRDEVGTGALHSALHYFSPHDPGDMVNVSGAGVLKSSSHPAAAQAFVAFLVSEAGQQVLAHSHSYEYPLRPGVSPHPGLRPFDQLQPLEIPLTALGDGSAALALEQKVGLL